MFILHTRTDRTQRTRRYTVEEKEAFLYTLLSESIA